MSLYLIERGYSILECVCAVDVRTPRPSLARGRGPSLQSRSSHYSDSSQASSSTASSSSGTSTVKVPEADLALYSRLTATFAE